MVEFEAEGRGALGDSCRCVARGNDRHNAEVVEALDEGGRLRVKGILETHRGQQAFIGEEEAVSLCEGRGFSMADFAEEIGRAEVVGATVNLSLNAFSWKRFETLDGGKSGGIVGGEVCCRAHGSRGCVPLNSARSRLS